MEWGLGRLADILGEYDNQALDFLSYMIWDAGLLTITPVESAGT